MEIRLRFAPSPTGQVHIGNIRVALFNWLYARHTGGTFLLRIEDTDRERSTPAAVAHLRQCLEWLQLDYDEEPLSQSQRAEAHLAAAQQLQDGGWVYEKDGAKFFRFPWDADGIDFVQDDSPQEWELHADVPLAVGPDGLACAQVSKKGKPMETTACLAGFRGLEVFDAGGDRLWGLEDHAAEVLGGQTFTFSQAARITFRRRLVGFRDLVKGELKKPLDSMKDLVVVRSDGSPVFHLANVCDDLEQRVSHVVRGDDHVENTYRHLFLFLALGQPAPAYAHLPMIVNDKGKPYSKRDGDAFVGDFREAGFLPEALVNYLALLGWSPGDDREKMSRQELIEAFTLDRVISSPARMDLRKLQNLNGQYLAELSPEDFIARARAAVAGQEWAQQADPEQFAAVARLLQSRTKLCTQVSDWAHFFQDELDYDQGAVKKFLKGEQVAGALRDLCLVLPDLEWTENELEGAVVAATQTQGLKQGKLNQPLRVALTGVTTGAGIFETMLLLGRERVAQRLTYAVDELCH